jgi:hypothetical protein
MIIDGMDQNHSKIPQTRETAFSDPLTQHLTGVLIHGIGIIIYIFRILSYYCFEMVYNNRT